MVWLLKEIGKDKMCWKPHQKKGFKFGTFYQLLGALEALMSSLSLGKSFGDQRPR